MGGRPIGIRSEEFMIKDLSGNEKLLRISDLVYELEESGLISTVGKQEEWKQDLTLTISYDAKKYQIKCKIKTDVLLMGFTLSPLGQKIQKLHKKTYNPTMENHFNNFIENLPNHGFEVQII